MNSQSWPIVSHGEERTIPVPSNNTDAIVVELFLSTRETRVVFEEVIAAHPVFCAQQGTYGASSTAQLIIIEAGYDHHPTFEFIESLSQQDDRPDIFLTTLAPGKNMVTQALQLGVKEIFPMPLQRQEILAALDRYAASRGKTQKKRRRKVREVISFFGGRGGIGTTTTAVNFGISLCQAHGAPSVVLVEWNDHVGDLALFLDITIPHTLRELRNTGSQLDPSTLEPFLVKHDSGLHVLSLGYPDTQDKQFPTEWIAPIFKLLKARFDFVLIDCGHTLGTNISTVLGLSSTIILLSTLTMIVVKRTELVLEFLIRAGIPSAKIQWVLNRYIEKENRILKETEKIFNRKTSWIIPNDFPRASQALNAGSPLVLAAPKSAIAKSFRHMAESFLAHPEVVDSQSSSKHSQWVNRIWEKVMKEHHPATVAKS